MAVSAVVGRGQDQNKMTARNIWDLPLLYSLLDVMCSVCPEVAVYSTPVLEERGTDI